MRTEVKLAVVVVLVAVIGAASYFLSRGNEKPIELTSPKPPVARVQEMPLPLGPGGGAAVTEKAEPRTELPATPTVVPPSVSEIVRQPAEPSKPVYKIDLNPPGEATTKPGKSAARGRPGAESSLAKVIPNQPARIDLDNSPGNPAGEPAATVHVVKPGETLFQIAKHYYGRGDLSTRIMEANQGVSPRTLRAGAKLTIPPAPGGKTKTPTTHATKASTPNLPKSVDRSKVKTYTVKPGENFYRIARNELGNGTRWKEIFELNKAQMKNDPKNLRSGQTIYVPVK